MPISLSIVLVPSDRPSYVFTQLGLTRDAARCVPQYNTAVKCNEGAVQKAIWSDGSNHLGVLECHAVNTPPSVDALASAYRIENADNREKGTGEGAMQQHHVRVSDSWAAAVTVAQTAPLPPSLPH